MKRPPFLILILLLAQVAAVLLLLGGLFPPLARGPRVAVVSHPVAPPPAPHPGSAVILCYHALSKKPSSPYVTSVQEFTKQMEWLAQQHYRVVPISQLVGYFTSHQALPDSLVAITFDDGYASVLTEAWPVLKQHGFPFALFIYPGYIGRGKGSMSWQQIIAADSAGVTIGSHTMTHPVLTHAEGKNATEYQKWLARELAGSRDTLAKRLGHAVDLLAYPFGAFDQAVEDAARAAGYRACFTVNAGVNDSAASPYQLDRVIIGRDYSFPLFQATVATHSVRLAALRPMPGEAVAASRNLDISARIDNFQDLVPSSIRILVTRSKGKGVMDTSRALARFLLDRPLKKGFHEAAIYARSKSGQKCVGCWMFLVRE